MEVFAEGFQPREVQFAIVEQNPTLLNITLFKEQNFQSPIQLANDLDGAPSDDIEDKLDLDLGLDEDEEEDLLRPPRPDSRSWENLLTWWPDYESFAGVFKDIAELPHVNLNSENDVCRPAPLGEHLSQRNDEEYL